MLVFASSDKGGTGRSVTSCNVAYHLSLQRHDVAYLDFDFGSPTAGAIFEIAKVDRGIDHGGLHSYVVGDVANPQSLEVRDHSDRQGLRATHAKAGRLVLYPGDRGGAEFSSKPGNIQRCVELFRRLDQEFDVCVVDLSAGRSHAVEMALEATAQSELASVAVRWLVFHRWTRQHIVAAHGLVYGEHGLLDTGADAGHDVGRLEDSIRFVRTAVPALNSPLAAGRAAQAKWLRTCNDELKQLALRNRVGHSRTLGETPMEPVLQWREQVISDADVAGNIANPETVQSFRELAWKLTDPVVWEALAT
ncbi:ParA family protein [Solihabitans fulvus]|uniref:ParA family protein n=1 Tax=Solihabitans fulvus TaxID=1892852 RepID=A0A5B2XU52_9PSEU|nr:SCO2523 family variant P-loop protein [Solihabitans fulvus]KAA2266490.1 ParA family protein [Solihabitans fulvus]